MSERPDPAHVPAPLPPPQHPDALRLRTHGWQAPPFEPGRGQQARWQQSEWAQTGWPQTGSAGPQSAWDRPQSGWPPQGPGSWGYGGYGAPPPRRRGAGRVLVGLVGLVSIAVFVLVIVAAFATGAESDPFVRDAGSNAPAAPSNPGAAPVDPAQYRQVLQQNTLYEQGGLRDRDCVATSLDDADTAEQRRYYERLMSCLDAAWAPLIESAGYRYDTPTLVVFDAPVSTPCGSAAPQDGRTLAFYCPTDSVLYADAPQMRRFFNDVEMAYAVVIGHEFGHHVQQEVGILVAFDDAVYARFADRLELSRRVELQASCLSGLFLGAVAPTYPITESDLVDLRQVSLSFGDEPGAADSERDHGSGGSNQEWILGAFDRNDAGWCNTFRASDRAVD